MRGGRKARGDTQRPREADAARPEAVREQPSGHADREPQQGAEREHERDVRARGAEFGLERLEERGEGIGHAEADEHQAEGA